MIVAMRGDQELGLKAADLAGRLRTRSRRWRGSLTTIAGAGIRAARRCFARSTGSLGSCGENPVRLLQETSGEALARAAADRALLDRVASLEDAFAADLRRPPAGLVAPERPIAFLCAEYGVHQSLPIYREGLGRWRATCSRRLRIGRCRWSRSA